MTHDEEGTPSREQVVLFEPRADLPVSEQPDFRHLLAIPRRQFLNPVLWLMVVGGTIGASLPGHPVGLVFPAIVAIVGALALVMHARRALFLPRAEFAAITEARPRQVTLGEGDLLRSGRIHAIRLPEEWLVTRLSTADAMALARFRRIWVFGPSPGGAIGFMATGGGAPRVARLASEPPAGAEPVPAPEPPAEWPAPPKDDPAVRHAIDDRVRVSLYSVALFAIVVGMATVDRIVRTGSRSMVADGTWWLASVLLVLFVLVTAGGIGRTRRARRAARWAWTRVETEEPDILNLTELTVRVRVDAAGNALHLKVSGPPALVLSVHESKVLWLIGDLNPRRPMVAGIPEVPAVGRTRAVKPPR
jgi:hypothetical protein